MAYKIKNPYKEAHIMDLNLMGIEPKSLHFCLSEILILTVPILIMAGIGFSSFLPDIGFFAECANVPGGDVCQISIK